MDEKTKAAMIKLLLLKHPDITVAEAARRIKELNEIVNRE